MRLKMFNPTAEPPTAFPRNLPMDGLDPLCVNPCSPHKAHSASGAVLSTRFEALCFGQRGSPVVQATGDSE